MPRPTTVLLVEDDPGDARLLRSALAGANAAHVINHVTTLADATAWLDQHEAPDVVLLDLTLPDSVGHRTFDLLLDAVGDEVAVVVLTGLDDDVAATAAVDAGAQDYLVKGSMTGPVIARSIRHAIERHRLQSALRERIKEQAGLFAISKTLHRDMPIAQRCTGIAGHLVTAMRFPSVCRAAVSIDGVQGTAGADPTGDQPVLTATIGVDGIDRGQIVVGYCEPGRDFALPEEQQLVESAADAISVWLARRDAVRQLVRDEERLRILVSQLPGIVWTTDLDLQISSATGAGLRVLGISSEEVVGTNVADLLETRHPGRTIEMFTAALDGRSVEFERHWRGRWWRNHVEPKRDSDGNIMGTVCLTTDITTEREQAEALEDDRRHFRSLFVNSPDAMILADDDGHCVDVNPAACALTGYDREELLGVRTTDLAALDQHVTPEVAGTLWQEFLDQGVMAGEYPIRRKDGTVVEAEYRAVADVVPGMHLSSLRDITDRKAAEQALATSEARFRNLAESSQDVVYQLQLTPERAFEYVSPAAETITGFPQQAFYDDPGRYFDRLSPDTGDPVEDALGAPDLLPSSSKVQFQHAAGHWLWLEDHHTVLTEQGRPVAILGMMRDVTAREQAVQALRDMLLAEQEATERLRAVDALKSSFLQAVSHELRTPLTSVLGYAHTLMSGKLTAEQTEHFHERLVVNAKRLDSLLSDLLDIERLNHGTVQLHVQSTDLAAVTARVADDVELGDHDLVVDRMPTHAAVDARQIERLVHNLVANAVKHTPAGSTIWISFETSEREVALIVADDGPGIPAADREHVFEPFWQSTGMHSSASPGTGIGLALVRQLATLHGGRTWVEPRDGGGAEFHVTLPRPTADTPTRVEK